MWFTWTETPLTEIWHQLRYLQSPANVRNLLSGKIESGRKKPLPTIDNESLEQKSCEIAACIRQADEYYKAANVVELSTHPLLQFYGAEALTKAVIIANDPDRYLSDFQYHGLSTKLLKESRENLSEPEVQRLEEYSKNDSIWKLEDEFAVANQGVFQYLCQVIGESAPGKGAVLKFKELVRILPDLSELYRRHYGEPSHCFYLYNGPSDVGEGKVAIHFGSHENINDVSKVFLEFNSKFESSEMHKQPGFISKDPIGLPLSFGSVQDGTLAGKYFVRPLKCELKESFSVIFAAMFILSNVVRYKPAFWMQEIEGTESGSVSIAEALCNLAKRRLPNEILNLIWQEKFEYGTPGRLS